MKAAYKIVNKIITPLAQKQGMVSGKIILDWHKIVSPEYASWTRPLKITFPKNIRKYGTLHLQVNPSHALVVEYGKDILIEKINIFFGYRAVSKIRIMQLPFDVQAQHKQNMNKNRKIAENRIKNIDYQHSRRKMSNSKLSDSINRINSALHELGELIKKEKK